MSRDLNLPEGVPVPSWFRRYLEARANDVGPADVPPPLAAAVPPPPPRVNTSRRYVETFEPWVGRTLMELNLL